MHDFHFHHCNSARRGSGKYYPLSNKHGSGQIPVWSLEDGLCKGPAIHVTTASGRIKHRNRLFLVVCDGYFARCSGTSGCGASRALSSLRHCLTCPRTVREGRRAGGNDDDAPDGATTARIASAVLRTRTVSGWDLVVHPVGQVQAHWQHPTPVRATGSGHRPWFPKSTHWPPAKSLNEPWGEVSLFLDVVGFRCPKFWN